MKATPNWRKLLEQAVEWALAFPRASVGASNPANNAMVAITTKSSTIENPARRRQWAAGFMGVFITF
jgi:hypothetical protein